MATSAAQVRALGDALVTWIASFPLCMRQSGAVAKHTDPSVGYIRKHLVRKFALSLCGQVSGAAEKELTLHDEVTLCPDRKRHLDALSQSMTWVEVRVQFGGISALMISCWACLFSDVPLAQRKYFDDVKFNKLAQKAYEALKKEGRFPCVNGWTKRILSYSSD